MTTKEVATRAGLSDSQIRALVSDGRLTRAGRNKFDPATAGWEIADYWREKATPEEPLTDEEMNALLAEELDKAFPQLSERELEKRLRARGMEPI